MSCVATDMANPLSLYPFSRFSKPAAPPFRRALDMSRSSRSHSALPSFWTLPRKPVEGGPPPRDSRGQARGEAKAPGREGGAGVEIAASLAGAGADGRPRRDVRGHARGE